MISNLGLNHGGKELTTKAFVELVGELELSAIFRGLGEAESEVFKKDLAKLFEDAAHPNYNKAKGAQHQLAMLMEISRDAANRGTITKIEFKVDAETGNRVMDLVVRQGDKILYIEAKAWSRGYWKAGIRRSLSRIPEKGAEDVDAPGQMMRDFARNAQAIKDGDLPAIDIEWRFSPEGLADLSEDTIKAAEEEIRDIVIETIKNNDTIKSDIVSSLALAVDDVDDVLEGMLSPNGELYNAITKIVRIEPYLKTLDQL